MATTLSFPAELSIALAALDPARMLALITTLGAPDFAGRRVGTEGHARASSFLLDQFRLAGWDVSTQDFPITTPVVDMIALPSLAQFNPDGSLSRSFAHRTEFCEHPRSASAFQIQEGPVVTHPYGTDRKYARSLGDAGSRTAGKRLYRTGRPACGTRGTWASDSPLRQC